MEKATEAFAALCFFGIGLSHILQPIAWVQFFTWLHDKGRVGMFVEGFLCLNFGAFIVSFHNVWSGLAVVLTVIGWGQLLKGLIRFSAPELSLRIYERVTPERAWQFQVAGIFALALSCFLGYVACSR